MKNEYDVIIVGAGMVGGALAAAIGNSRLRICLLDAGKPDVTWPYDEYELRVSAITKASQTLLNKIGAWDRIVERRCFPYQKMHVWDATGSGEIHFDCADVGEACLGHIIENRVIQGAIIDQLHTLPQVDLRFGVRPQSLNINIDGVTLELNDDTQLSAKLIVGADGARSWIRDCSDIDTIGWSYQQNGLVTTVTLEETHQETAWQRFLPTGPLAFLPLDEKHCSIVWSTTQDESVRLCGLDEQTFIDELNTAIGEQGPGKVVAIGKRAAFPLSLQHARDYVRDRVVLVGDAAHTIHPLAGQGVNLGFLDAALLAEVLMDAANAHKDIGQLSVLRRYERGRKADNVMMMSAMDGFKRLFSNEIKPLSVLRNMGLNLANSVPPLKQLFIQQAMGMRRDLPKLVRSGH
ncbi:MAG: UbiH/UbiF/VisC/COQ6 family ubiquinone biosynthesis hydroxylase [Gammaproteobacteria bacterium]|nr:UbiH/UbiF/VisC/COQ6 family ubiquinone biosynthesis hydroxylase [Gammaproteobacteria bacterium]